MERLISKNIISKRIDIKKGKRLLSFFYTLQTQLQSYCKLF